MVIIGAGGHSLEVLDVLLEKELADKLFLFDNISEKISDNICHPVIRSFEELKARFHGQFEFLLGIGNPLDRFNLLNKFIQLNATHRQIISNTASISKSVQGEMFDAMKHTFIGPATRIGEGVLVNTGAQVHHECKIGKFTVISPNATILGKCNIGEFCYIGAGSTILPNVKISNNVIIGAGTIVTRNISESGTYYGVPARKA